MRGATDNASESHFIPATTPPPAAAALAGLTWASAHSGNGVSGPSPGKWIKKLKSENMQKQQKWCILKYI